MDVASFSQRRDKNTFSLRLYDKKKFKNTVISILRYSEDTKAENIGKQSAILRSWGGLISLLIMSNRKLVWGHGSWPIVPKSWHILTTALIETVTMLQKRHKSLKLHNDFCLDMALLWWQKDAATLKNHADSQKCWLFQNSSSLIKARDLSIGSRSR